MTHQQRLERLEKQNKRIKWAAVGIGAVFLCMVTSGQSKPQQIPRVIRAHAFEVVNEKGMVVAKLEASDQGGLIYTKNDLGHTVFAMGTDTVGNGTFYTLNRYGRKLIRLGTNGTGNGAIAINNYSGQPVLRLIVDENGGGIGLSNKEGKIVCTMKANESGEGEIGAFNSAGKGRKIIPESSALTQIK